MFHAEPWQPALWFILCGVGVGFAFAVMPKLIVDAVGPTETGIATGMNTVVRTVGSVVAAQVGAVLLAASSVAGTAIPAESGFTTSLWLGAAAALGGGAPRAGDLAAATGAPGGARRHDDDLATARPPGPASRPGAPATSPRGGSSSSGTSPRTSGAG